jgi:membrane protein required for colicin V production
MADVSAVDWICLFVLLASLVLAMWRGFVYEMLTAAGWVVAFFVAYGSAAAVGGWLPMGETSEPLRHAAGFLLVFIVAAFIGGFFAARGRRAVQLLGIRPVDRVFGAVFGVVRGLVLLLALAAALLHTPLHQEAWWRHSASAQWLEQTLGQIHPFLPPALGKYLSA